MVNHPGAGSHPHPSAAVGSLPTSILGWVLPPGRPVGPGTVRSKGHPRGLATSTAGSRSEIGAATSREVMGRGGNPSARPCPEIMLGREEGVPAATGVLGSWGSAPTHSWAPATAWGGPSPGLCSGGSRGSVALGRCEGPPCAGVMSHAWSHTGHAGAGVLAQRAEGLCGCSSIRCCPGEEMAGTLRLFSLTNNQLNIKARQGRARTGTGAWCRDQGWLCTGAASLPTPACCSRALPSSALGQVLPHASP